MTCRAWPEASRRLLWVIGGKAHIEHMFSGLPRYQTFDGGAGLYSARNVVERFLTKIKQCRLVATCYDKLAADYLDRRSGAGCANESTPWRRPGT